MYKQTIHINIQASIRKVTA